MDNPEREFMQFIQGMACAEGMEESTATLFSTLYLEPQEISMDDLAKKTGYSLATISNKLSFLEMTGLVRKNKHPGSKKLYLYMEKDLMANLKKKLVAKHEQGIEKAKAKMPEIIEGMRSKARTEEQKMKLKVMEEYMHQVKKADTLIKKVLEIINKVN